MKNFLLEIGTEEMPAHFFKLALEQMSEKVDSDLQRVRLKYGNISCTCTPRRLVLFIEDVSELANDFIEERKGPPLDIAFKDGAPTQAAIGFAKRCNLEPKDLAIQKTNKGSFVFAKVIEKGRSANELLADLLPDWIDQLQGKRFMSWGAGERRFSRPIRWLVSLLGDDLIPLKLSDCDPEIQSSNISRGHRLYEDHLEITSAEDYFHILEGAGVNVNRAFRKTQIIDLINSESEKNKSLPDFPIDLQEELTDLVELPSLICGEFDDSFLSLPHEVLTTVMKVHQRYVPLYLVEKADIDPLSLEANNLLLPKFLFISNGLKDSNQNIRKGNERVLKARLSDAKFFYDADLSIPSSQRLELLKDVSFSKGLGSLYDRVKRIEWLVNLLIEVLEGPNVNPSNTTRAALLCKSDLVSQMVGEFPELEGVMGGKYLLHENEPREVALAVFEHYLPRGSSDLLPQSDSGAILSLAEKFELLLSIFSKGDRPSGSSDPYALRRAGNGILQILFDKNWKFDINQLLINSINHWSHLFPDFKTNKKLIFEDLADFFRQRIITQLEEYEIDIDLVLAVSGPNVSISRLLSDPVDVLLRANLLSKLRSEGKLSMLQSVVARASRLADKSSLPSETLGASKIINPSLFEKSSEREILNLINKLQPITESKDKDSYIHLADELLGGANALAGFFDGENSVMVMTNDLKIRENRLNLLKIIKNQANILADFNQISG